MSPPQARTADIFARLTAAGLSPEVTEAADHTRIEAKVPTPFPAEAWPQVVAALEKADWFGLAHSSERGGSLWAAVRKRGPEAADVADRSPHQPRS